MNRRIAVRAIIFQNDKLLCVRLNPYKEATPVDFWCLPGGTLDEGEALQAALSREMVEETGISPQIGNLLYIQQFVHKGVDTLEFFFHVTNTQDYQNIDLASTSHGSVEIAEISFVDPANTVILPKFLSNEPIADKITRVSPPTIFSNAW